MSRNTKLIVGGCLALAALPVLCAVAFVVAARGAVSSVAPPAPPSVPIDVSGECPTDEVVAYFDDWKNRQDRFYSPLQAMEDTDDAEGPLAAFNNVDVGAMRRARDELANSSVPPCLVELRDEEVALADLIIQAVESAQGESRLSGLRAARSVLLLVSRVHVHVERQAEARRLLRERLGVELMPGDGMATEQPER